MRTPRRTLPINVASLVLALALCLAAYASADTTLDLKNEFIEKFKNRAC